MKVWCETCEGKGQIEASGLFENEFKDCIYNCPDCNGKGYTENNCINYQARVGRAALKIVGMYMFDDIEEMLRIAESEE